MMGVAITTDELPILKQNNAILAFDAAEAALLSHLLHPLRPVRGGMSHAPDAHQAGKSCGQEDVDALQELDIMTCMECGCCALFLPCPAEGWYRRFAWARAM